METTERTEQTVLCWGEGGSKWIIFILMEKETAQWEEWCQLVTTTASLGLRCSADGVAVGKYLRRPHSLAGLSFGCHPYVQPSWGWLRNTKAGVVRRLPLSPCFAAVRGGG